MHLAQQRLVLAFRPGVIGSEQAPQAVDEARATLDPRFGPRQVAFGRAVGQHEPAHCVGAIGVDDGVGVDHVLLRLGHLDDAADLDRAAICLEQRAFGFAADLVRREVERLAPVLAAVGLMRDHALREQRGEGFGHVDLAHMRQCAGPEPGVEQVQDRVFDPADILFDRQPFGDLVPVERLVRRLAGEAQEIPRTVDESVERVGLAFRLPAAFGAIDMFPSGMAQQRIARSPEIDILGQRDRQAVLGRGDHAAFLAMDEGDRRAPVPLARHTPVAQPPHGLAAAASLFLDARDDCALGVLDFHPVKKVRIDEHALPRLGLALAALDNPTAHIAAAPIPQQSLHGGLPFIWKKRHLNK